MAQDVGLLGHTSRGIRPNRYIHEVGSNPEFVEASVMSSAKLKDGGPRRIKCQVGSQVTTKGISRAVTVSVVPGRAFLVKLLSVSERYIIDATSPQNCDITPGDCHSH